MKQTTVNAYETKTSNGKVTTENWRSNDQNSTKELGIINKSSTGANTRKVNNWYVELSQDQATCNEREFCTTVEEVKNYEEKHEVNRIHVNIIEHSGIALLNIGA